MNRSKKSKKGKKKEKDLKKLQMVQDLRSADPKYLKKLIRLQYKSLDTTGKSIAGENLKRVLRKRDDIAWTRIAAKSTLFKDGKSQQQFQRAVKKWAMVMERRNGVVPVVRVEALPEASESIWTSMNNTGRLAKKRMSDLK